jgi:fluoroacetyl-CoA thioesterase
MAGEGEPPALDGLQPGLRHSATILVGEALAVPAASRLFEGPADMPAVFATASMVAFVEWTCVAALAPYLGAERRTVGTLVDMTHSAATPIGMRVTAEIELVARDGNRLRFKVACRDEAEEIGAGFHERVVIDPARFERRLARKRADRRA